MPRVRVGLRPHPLLLLVVAALVAGCASGRPAPTVTIAQTSSVAALRLDTPSGGLPVDYRLEVTNPSDDAVTLTSVEIESVGLSGGYLLKRVRHGFDRVIAPHGTVTIDVRAWVFPLQQSDTGQVVSPVLLRGTARFDDNGQTLQRAFTGRVP